MVVQVYSLWVGGRLALCLVTDASFSGDPIELLVDGARAFWSVEEAPCWEHGEQAIEFRPGDVRIGEPFYDVFWCKACDRPSALKELLVLGPRTAGDPGSPLVSLGDEDLRLLRRDGYLWLGSEELCFYPEIDEALLAEERELSL